jgi:hypothetical protein
LKNKTKYEIQFKKYLKQDPYLFPHHAELPRIDFLKGDFLEIDWKEASFVFTNSLTFSNELMDEIFSRAMMLKSGSFFINTTKHLPKNYQNKWEIIKPFSRLMSWGCCNIFLYRKK